MLTLLGEVERLKNPKVEQTNKHENTSETVSRNVGEGQCPYETEREVSSWQLGTKEVVRLHAYSTDYPES